MTETENRQAAPGAFEMIELEQLCQHPRNRSFVTQGDEWTQFVDSIRRNGVMQPLLVRPFSLEGIYPDALLVGTAPAYQIVSGHRRACAAGLAGLLTVPCIVREMTEAEALEILIIDNLQRKDLDPVEEARGVQALVEDLRMSAAEVAERISRSVRWVETRQLIFELGDEVQEALRKPRADRGHLDIGAVEPILEVPTAQRAEAVQLILHSNLYGGEPVPAADAARVIRQSLLEPLRRREAWEAGKKPLVKVWKAKLGKLLPKDLRERLLVLPAELNDRGSGLVDAETQVPRDQCTEAAPEPLLWLHLAARHELVVKIYPIEGTDDQTVAMVQESVLRQAEEALGRAAEEARASIDRGVIGREHQVADLEALKGLPQAWLGRRKALKTQDGKTQDTRLEKEDEDERVNRAQAALDGEADPLWVAEEERRADAEVIEQGVERTMVIDFTPVGRVREWAYRCDNDDSLDSGHFGSDFEKWIEALGNPDWVPGWAIGVAWHGSFDLVATACEWIEGLKYAPLSKS